jgi:glycosyltransferase involved in cell wall biosynthesis
VDILFTMCESLEWNDPAPIIAVNPDGLFRGCRSESGLRRLIGSFGYTVEDSSREWGDYNLAYSGGLLKILWIPHTAWRIPQRAHLFCRALAENHEVHVTDWAADFYSWRDYLDHRYLRNFHYRLSRDGNITVHGIPRVSPTLHLDSLRRWNATIFSAWVDRLIRQYHIDVVVGTFVVRPPKSPRLVFDLFDDNVAYWLQYGRMKQYAGEIESTERAYLQNADMVVAASSVLADKTRALTSRPICHIPNAVDLERFQKADGTPLRLQWKALGGIVGMLGNNDKPAELQKILDAAKLLSEEHLIFIIAGRGSAVPDAKKNASREGLTNVKFLKEVALENASDIIDAFDIGLCPYLKTPGADAGSPMRLLLYAAAGLPTVCTDLEEVRRMAFPNVVLVKDDPESLAEGIRQARRLPRSRPAQIAAYDVRRLAREYELVLSA